MRASIESGHFLLRRLHSLFGLLPVGGFLLFHLWENSQSRFGAEHYNQVVADINSMNYLLILEVFVIALPLLFHALYGLVIWWYGKANVLQFGYAKNWLWWLQRVSGIGILLFVGIHVWATRIYSIYHPEIKADMFGYMHALLSAPEAMVTYVVGLALAVFHLSNGLWTMAISWGLTTTDRAQNISRVVFTAVGIVAFVLGIHGLLGFFGWKPLV